MSRPKIPRPGDNLDLGVVWASTRLMPEPVERKRAYGIFFTCRETYALVHQFVVRSNADRTAVAMLWEHALALLGVCPAHSVGARAMLRSSHAHRYRRGALMSLYGQRCRVLGTSITNDDVITLRVEHPRAGTLRVLVDHRDHILEWDVDASLPEAAQ